MLKNYKFILCLILAGFLTSNANAVGCSQPHTIRQWLNTGGFSNLTFTWVSSTLPTPASCVVTTAVVDSQSGVHVYSMDANGHLIESYQQFIGGSWVVIDITQRTGVSINSVPTALHMQNTFADIQIFAAGVNGHLESFNTTNNTFTYQVFDLTAASGGVAILGNPAPIQVGSTVHVYANDSAGGLHDFYKPVSTNWQDINLTQVYGGTPRGVAPQPFFYGGNSIQIVGDAGLGGGDLVVFIELINSDGTISGFPFEGDITAMAGGTGLTGAPRPLVVGPTSADVAIFGDDTGGNLVEFFKAPSPAPWTERNSFSPRPAITRLTPSALFFPNVSTDRTVRVYSNTNISHLFEYILNPETGAQLQSGDLSNVLGVTIFSDPYAITVQGNIEVYTLN